MSLNICKSEFPFLNNNKRCYSTKNSPKFNSNNLGNIFSFINLNKLYFIKREFISKFFFIILFILAILFVISLFILIFEVNLYDYYNIGSIMPILCTGYLMYKRRDLLIKLSINSIYVISNLLLLTLILATVVYIVTHFLPFDFKIESFKDSLIFSKELFGYLLSWKLTIHIIKMIYSNMNNVKELSKKLGWLLISLLVLSFFYQIIFIILGASDLIVNIIINNDNNIESKITDKSLINNHNLNIESKITDKSFINNKIESKSKIIDKSLINNNIESKSKITDKSLNYESSKEYPIANKGEGCYIITPEGRRIFDASSGAAVTSLGYNHPKMTEIILEQFNTGIRYVSHAHFSSKVSSELVNKLLETSDGQMAKVFLTISGSDGIEAALKLARQYFYDQDNETSRDSFIARERSYHGNTLGALSISEFLSRQLPYKDILMKNVYHISSFYPFRQQLEGESDEAFVTKKARELEDKILEVGPDKIMAFIFEPISGAALGCVTPLPGYLKAMLDVCHKYDILFICDEVMCGMGRTGFWYASLAEGVVPDMIIVSKGLSAGEASISAILVSEKIWKVLEKSGKPFIHGLTNDASPMASAAALGVINILEEDNLLENSRELGFYLKEKLIKELGDHPNVGNIRGQGLFVAIEFVVNKITKEPFDSKLCISEKIFDLAISPEFNLALYQGKGNVDGVRGDHIMIMPPLIVTEQEVDLIVKQVSQIIVRIFKEIEK